MRISSVFFKRFAAVKWAAAITGAIYLASVIFACAASETNAIPAKAPLKQKRVLSGADLYAIHCNRCHPERYPVERDSAEWQTIMMHMRVRANLPAAQARTIAEYLQKQSGD